jgi:periplasmic protein CpxP/Spy
MSTQSPFPAEPPQAAPKPRRLRRVVYALALLTGGGIIGAVVAGPVIGQGWYGPPWHHHGWGYGPRGHDAPYGMHPGEFGGRAFGHGRVERGVDRAMWFIDASSEQRSKIRAIVERTADDLFALRDKHIEGRRQIASVLGAATIDRGKLDALRTEQMALADTASKRITDAVAEAAEVLTPAQRADLARWFERWHRWRHG